MIIWRGWGFLAAVLLFGGLVAVQLVVDAIGGDGAYRGNVLLMAALASRSVVPQRFSWPDGSTIAIHHAGSWTRPRERW